MSGHGHAAGGGSAREDILAKVRKAVGRQPGQVPAVAPAARIRIPSIPAESRVALFQERLEVLGGKVYRAATKARACEIVEELLSGATAVASDAPLLAAAGITRLPGVECGFADTASLRAACATAGFGITCADYGLAETGSVVTRSASESRLASLLPPAHIALLPLSKMLTGLDELYTLVPKPSKDTASMVLITGPSRSADIEMILVRGVHGPRVIHVIVVEEE
jgi:L-lactate dehydrogenase complex protein LldG